MFRFRFLSEGGWTAGFSAEDLGVEVDALAVYVAGAVEQRHGHAEQPEQSEGDDLADNDFEPRHGNVHRKGCYHPGCVLVQPCTVS